MVFHVFGPPRPPLRPHGPAPRPSSGSASEALPPGSARPALAGSGPLSPEGRGTVSVGRTSRVIRGTVSVGAPWYGSIMVDPNVGPEGGLEIHSCGRRWWDSLRLVRFCSRPSAGESRSSDGNVCPDRGAPGGLVGVFFSFFGFLGSFNCKPRRLLLEAAVSGSSTGAPASPAEVCPYNHTL